jgi:16S rRNA (uracil1498-N3)-methyltransferase
MKTRRFFIAPDEIQGSRARLSPEESHHLRDVLRLRPADEVELFDGTGSVYRSKICTTGSQVELEIIEKLATSAESPLKIILGQSILKSEKMSWVIQKCTELGITELYPLTTRFSEPNLRQQAARLGDHRWKKIAISAAAQCQRAYTPIIHPIMELQELCRQLSGQTGSSSFLPGMESRCQPSLKLVISEKGGLPARSLSGFASPASVLLVVGPEGGWALDEISLFQDAGFMEIFLGCRILRSETAALAAVTLAQFLWGDLGIP